MARNGAVHACQSCGAVHAKWAGRRTARGASNISGAGGEPDHPEPQGPGQGVVGARPGRRQALPPGGESGGQEAPAYYIGGAEPKEGSAKHLDWQALRDPVRNLAEIIIGKQRHGPIGVVRLHFNENLTKFSNHAREGRYAVR